MSDKPMNVLFLCTGNSARSILGEAILNHDGQGRFSACSAGSNPTGTVNPWAIHTLKTLGYPSEGYSSKSWSEFADGPEFDLIFTVCDSAAAEACPVWPGRPTSAHWGMNTEQVEDQPEGWRTLWLAIVGVMAITLTWNVLMLSLNGISY